MRHLQTLDSVTPFPALAVIAVAILTCWLLAKAFGAPPAPKHFRSLDGLRGYLALLVFIHHSSIWFGYLRTGAWRVPPSYLYTHFGQSSVALFFMITGFLFSLKLLDGRQRRIDWRKLFVSRIFRILPLYWLVFAIVLGAVVFLSGGKLQVSPLILAKELLEWALFMDPNINGVVAGEIIGGVTWSLKYEALFYVALPLLALFIGIVAPKRFLLLGVVGVAGGLIVVHPEPIRLVPFLGGAAAALLVRNTRVRQLAETYYGSLAVFVLTVLVCRYPTGYAIAPLILLSVCFIIIASGNNLFGLLELPASRLMGEMAYSIYLLHGLCLYVLIHVVLGSVGAGKLSALGHWSWILGVTPVLLGLSYATHRFVELTGMRAGRKLANRLQPVKETMPFVSTSVIPQIVTSSCEPEN
ncbi:MAG: acyltransferase [Acidobacteriota bacterium]